mmetsp:Transcript_2215/g.4730  ORF Transcript_2215/g.4730 Transcript_2215/m.4730 type:complete len:151 (+) Transcript_2215:1-453(+)
MNPPNMMNPMNMMMMTQAPTPTPEPERRRRVLRDILQYHIAPNVFRIRDLSCSGSARNVRMLRFGTSRTRCVGRFPNAQSGTCNSARNLPRFAQTNILASNGIMHIVNNVLIPSPDGTTAGCGLLVSRRPTPNPTRRPTPAPTPAPIPSF